MMRPPRNFGQQAARASWIAPIVAIVIGVLTAPTRNEDRTAALIIGGINVLILTAGGVFAVVALLGMRRWGRGGVLAPAVVGFVLFLFFGYSVMTSLNAARRVNAQQEAREADLKQLHKEGEDAFFRAGWFGAVQHDGGALTVTALPDDVSFVAEMLATLNVPVSILTVGIDNSRGADTVTVDPTGAMLHFADGTSISAPDINTVLGSIASPQERAEAIRAFGPPFVAHPGTQLVGRFIFLPKGANAQTMERITLTFNGQPVDIHGQHYTELEKRELHRLAQDGQAAGAASEPQ